VLVGGDVVGDGITPHTTTIQSHQPTILMTGDISVVLFCFIMGRLVEVVGSWVMCMHCFRTCELQLVVSISYFPLPV
jgi:hypothetical protein